MDEILRKAPWVFYLLLPPLFICIPIINIVEGILNSPITLYTTQQKDGFSV